VIQPEDLPESILERGLGTSVAGAKYHREVKELKKRLIVDALEESDHNYTEAARSLGVHVNYLHRLIRNLDLKESLQSSSSLRPATERLHRKGSRQLET
jgi:transcriptional regulator with GAF, ATPase, and Fis domain